MSGESDNQNQSDGEHPRGGKTAQGAPAASAKPATGAAPRAKSGSKTSEAAPTGVARKPDLLTILIAAVLGAGIALIAQYAMDASGLRPSAAGGGATDLEHRVSALEQTGGIRTGDASSAAVTELRRSLARLQDEVTAIAARPAGTAAGDLSGLNRAIGDLEARLDGNEARLGALETRTPSDLPERLERFADVDSVAALDARVVQLEADALQNDTRRAAMGLGLAQLARAAQGARPFVEEHAAIALLRPADPLVAQFAPYATTGVPTFAMLRDDFPAVARTAARAAHTVEEPTAWGRVWAWLGQAISFRRTGDAEGGDASAILARAERGMAEGDLAAALSQMNTLPEGARASSATWIAAAEARVALDRLTTALSLEIIAELGQ
jgi:hypothetical protein